VNISHIMTTTITIT